MKEEISLGGKRLKITEGIVNALLIFILGFLVGVAVKTEAKKRVTIGYDDFMLPKLESGFDLTQKEEIPNENTAPVQQPESPAPQPESPAGNGTEQNSN